MTNVIKNDKGMTLLEVIVVLAVIGALAAMLSPVVFRYIDDANRSRAQNDANVIAAAINQFYSDTGRWPFYAVGTGKIAWTSGTDAAFLSSDPDCTVAAAAVAADACILNAPSAGSATGWALPTAFVESLTSQLIKGVPTGGAAYATTGPRAVRPPYLDAVPELDPFGRNYLVNIGKADQADTTPEVVFVLSAGQNGIIETNGGVEATAGSFTAGGDDIIARVK